MCILAQFQTNPLLAITSSVSYTPLSKRAIVVRLEVEIWTTYCLGNIFVNQKEEFLNLHRAKKRNLLQAQSNEKSFLPYSYTKLLCQI